MTITREKTIKEIFEKTEFLTDGSPEQNKFFNHMVEIFRNPWDYSQTLGWYDFLQRVPATTDPEDAVDYLWPKYIAQKIQAAYPEPKFHIKARRTDKSS